MTKYELSLSPDYVPAWTRVDAIRELFQNAIDQETQHQDNKMFHSYDPVTTTLIVGNRISVLEPGTLLLGTSTKRDDKSTVGQFGEGYKIAALVLTRLGKQMEIHNYGAKQIWRPRFSKSKKYNSTILVFEVESYSIWPFAKAPDNNLTIVVKGISTEEYTQIVESNLHLCASLIESIKTTHGRILLNKPGRIFVNGLAVCNYDAYKYGYDFKPSKIKLDRDRKLVSDFDLKWLASTMWAEAAGQSNEAAEVFLTLAKSSAADVAFVDSHIYNVADKLVTTFNKAYEDFKEEYGDDAEPVSENYELDDLRENCPHVKPVIVSTGYKSMIKRSSDYAPPERIERKPPRQELWDWYCEWHEQFPQACKEPFEEIFRRLQ